MTFGTGTSTERCPITPAILSSRIVAILRGTIPDHVVRVAHLMVEEGFDCLELALTTPDAYQLLNALHDDLGPGVTLGAGTVIGLESARRALDSGAQFFASPILEPEVVSFGLSQNCPTYAGALTPTEVVAVWRAGAAAVKLFPAGHGGPGYIRELRAPLPDIPLLVTGGVSIDEVGTYLSAGAVAVGLGGALVGDVLSGGSLDSLRARVRRVLELRRVFAPQ